MLADVKDYSNVALACDDDAHKVVLFACSIFFKINVRKLFVAFAIFLPIQRFFSKNLERFKGLVLESNDTETETTRSRYSNHGAARLSPAKWLSLL